MCVGIYCDLNRVKNGNLILGNVLSTALVSTYIVSNLTYCGTGRSNSLFKSLAFVSAKLAGGNLKNLVTPPVSTGVNLVSGAYAGTCFIGRLAIVVSLHSRKSGNRNVSKSLTANAVVSICNVELFNIAVKGLGNLKSKSNKLASEIALIAGISHKPDLNESVRISVIFSRY